MDDTMQRDFPLTDSELAKKRSNSIYWANIERHNITQFTCDSCLLRFICIFVFDWYNTSGDCLASK